MTVIGEPIEFPSFAGAWVVAFYAHSDLSQEPVVVSAGETPAWTDVEHYILLISIPGRDGVEAAEVAAEYRTILGHTMIEND